MGDLADRPSPEEMLAEEEALTPRRVRAQVPKGFEPGVRFDPEGHPVEIVTDLVSEAPTEDEWRSLVEGMGIAMPTGWRLVLIEARFDPVAWTRDVEFVRNPESGRMVRTPATTRPAWRYRFRVERVSSDLADLSWLEGLLRKWKPRKPMTTTGSDVFVVVPADMQIGKVEPAVGGTERTIERVLALFDQALEEYHFLAKRGLVGPVALVLPGDGCEGYVSQGGRLVWRTDLNMTRMRTVYGRVIAHMVTELARVAPEVYVITVGGNHDQAVRQVDTTHDDSWDVQAVIELRDHMRLMAPEKFAHVHFHVPGTDSDVVAVDLAGTIVAVAHGHQFKGGAEKWWAGQSHGFRAAGEATVLISGHFHHLRVDTSGGNRTWIQAPALDNGSEWFTRQTGESSMAGLLTLTVGGGGWDRLRVLTWEGDR